MKKMRRGVALLLSALLVWTPAGTVRADEATGAADVNGRIEIQENKVSEDAGGSGGKCAGVNAYVWQGDCGSR